MPGALNVFSLFSRIILAAIEWRVKSHVVAGLHLYPPTIILLFRRSWDQSESDAKLVNLERLNLDATKRNLSKFLETLLQDLLCSILVHIRACSQVVNTRFDESAINVKQEKSDEFSPGTPAGRRNKGIREKKLTPICCAPYVLSMVVVVINSDLLRWSGRHRLVACSYRVGVSGRPLTPP